MFDNAQFKYFSGLKLSCDLIILNTLYALNCLLFFIQDSTYLAFKMGFMWVFSMLWYNFFVKYNDQEYMQRSHERQTCELYK